MKTIVITGGLGFIGSNLINILSKKNYFIINIDKVTYASNFNNISRNIKNYTLIFNLAAETHVDRSIDGPKQFINSNIYGVFNLLEVIRKFKKKIKLIHVSTDEVYGDIINNKSSKESDAYNPSSPYSASKASGDLLIKSYVRTYKIPAIITNCCNNYGPNQYPEKLIPTIIYKIVNNKPITIYGNGRNIREWIHVEDHCSALIKISEQGILGDNYNIGSGIELNNIDIVKKIIYSFKEIDINLANKAKFIFIKDRPGHDLRYSLNSSKIKKKLKWDCKYNFDKEIKKIIIWYIDKFNKNFFKNKNFIKRIGLKV